MTIANTKVPVQRLQVDLHGVHRNEQTLSSGTTGEKATTVLIAGDDADAKAQLARIVTDGGLLAIDAGTLRRARELEALGFLQMTLAAGEKFTWSGGFAIQN